MLGRTCMLATVLAAACVQRLPELPQNGGVWVGVVALLILAAGFWRAGVWSAYSAMGLAWRTLCVLACFLLMSVWAVERAQARLDDALGMQNDDKVSRVVLRVAQLVQESPDSRRFVADVLSSRVEGVPGRVEVAWHGPQFAGPYGHRGAPVSFPEIVPGQVWRMALNLRRVSGAHNPHGFDYEGHQFARGIRAQGSVRGTPELLEDADINSLSTLAERLRHRVREAMRPYLLDQAYAGVLLALTIGDQASIPSEQWEVFNRSGLTHLVSISGSHITMIAALGGWLMNAIWRRLSWRGRPMAERLPAQIVACLAALAVAWVYCLLAGWGVPARRTFLMLSVLAVAYAVRLPISASRLLSLAAMLVLVLDPWALMASGFWLSFGAVAVLFSLGSGAGQALAATPKRSKRQSLWNYLRQAAYLQLAISLALLPLLALWFNQLSLASPLANAYAIPLIGVGVTPLALLLGFAALVPGLDSLCMVLAWAAHGLLELCMPLTNALAALPWAVVDAASAPWGWMALALAGLALALMPRGWPLRPLAWLAMLPALCWRPTPLPEGEWRMTALDIGQGGAWVVQTARHTLLFDVGARHSATSDAGSRVVVPHLRAEGISAVSELIVSHADLDHVGGVRSLLDSVPVQRSFTSFDLAAFLRKEARQLGEQALPTFPHAMERCEQGRSWQVDGVHFDFIWPLAGAAGWPDARDTKARNANSCVLRVRGAYHSALLPGDVGAPQETRMVALGLVPPVDVMMAGHHGSRHSSAAAWVAASSPALVVAQAGRWNRYGHPHPDAIGRWRRQGSEFVSTSEQGAIIMHSTAQGLRWAGQKSLRRRYWHGA
ncbi:DNA internalization-related competence protein ComEC/Rec2 [Pusillimonas sp. CC-YST705]|uniref:DNA internalization-related competence protein ComEC/Rec2 n=1 Tax=Mesopusillimonas faecipullorum TaxID=2755040 RepID=A0ABS8CAC0_9BURK|nr:DNA internalization-related competence protein ComEC/Rec2 [Mesopusillimonas faecipullorum]MCB5362985.1 DNA internalization-related competence protein ComEC/Rec2 [Mesopusillimonas faecipullorum]